MASSSSLIAFSVSSLKLAKCEYGQAFRDPREGKVVLSQLTGGYNGNVFYNSAVNTAQFQASFDFEVRQPNEKGADGFTIDNFTLSASSKPTKPPKPIRKYTDNFDDGNADGWWLGYSQHTPWVDGNWRVEDGTLVQDQAGDAFIALLEGVESSDQTIEVQVKLNGPSGYGGVTLWFQDDNNWVNVLIYPAAKELWVLEYIDGVTNLSQYPYPTAENNIWYDLKVAANSKKGEMKVFINEDYVFTHDVATPNRTGQSGVNNGNAGGHFLT